LIDGITGLQYALQARPGGEGYYKDYRRKVRNLALSRIIGRVYYGSVISYWYIAEPVNAGKY
jgi:hypothetical protein